MCFIELSQLLVAGGPRQELRAFHGQEIAADQAALYSSHYFYKSFSRLNTWLNILYLHKNEVIGRALAQQSEALIESPITNSKDEKEFQPLRRSPKFWLSFIILVFHLSC